jgi:UDP-glucose 4-epimerase
MKIIVTGGAGFIGSHLVDTLIIQGHQVIIIDNLVTGKLENVNSQATFHNLDINSPEIESVFSSDIDAIIHLAAQIKVPKSFEDPIDDLNTNVLGGLNLLQNAIKNKIKKFVYINSAAEIGNPLINPIDENHPLNPISPYGISKQVFEKYLLLYAKKENINYSILRLANVYGPRQDHSGEGGVVSIFVNKILKGEVAQIYGHGQQRRDFIYVQDVVDVIIKSLNATNNGKYNIGSETEISVQGLFSTIVSLTGKEMYPSYVDAREGDIQRSLFDISKVKSELNWQPQVNLREGLTHTINYFKNG